MVRVHTAVEWAKTELARGESPGQFKSVTFRQRQRRLSRFIGKCEPRFFVQHKRTDEAVRAACSRHIDPDGQYAGYAPLKVQHVI